MNGKRAKALKQLSKQSGIAYEPLKNIYKKIGQMTPEQERKAFGKKQNSNENISNPS